MYAIHGFRMQCVNRNVLTFIPWMEDHFVKKKSQPAENAPITMSHSANKRVQGWLARVNLPTLVRWMDNAIRIPHTHIRVGLDALIGFLFPGVGDLVGSAISTALLWSAFKRRLPTVVLLRMLINLGVDFAFGALPFFGDAFDVFWRSNEKNLQLLERHSHESKQKPSTNDYLIVFVALVLVLATLLLPFVIVSAAGWWIFRSVHGS